MKNALGGLAEGDSYFGRQAEEQQVWEWIDTTGANILLLAPRRVGKTSFMKRLELNGPDRGIPAVFVTLAGAASVAEVLSVLEATLDNSRLSQIRRAGKAWAPSNVQAEVPGLKVSVGGVGGGSGAQARIERALVGWSSRRLVLVDELPICVQSILARERAEGERFLHWFRALRQTHPSTRWLLAGSIGLDQVVQREKMSDTINDLHPYYDFGEFDRSTAAAYLHALAAGTALPLGPTLVEEMLNRVGWLIPFHLAKYFERVRVHCTNARRSPDHRALEEAWTTMLADHHAFRWWDERLSRLYGKDGERHSQLILAACAKNPNGARAGDLKRVLSSACQEPGDRLQELLPILCTDGYLVHVSDRYRFRSNTVKEYWLRRGTK